MQPVLVPTRAQIADEYYTLDQAVKAFAPQAKRHTELASTIRSWTENDPAAETSVFEGATSTVLVSACSEERKLGFIAKTKIFKLIGKAAFLAIVNLTLKAATSATTEATVDQLATTERTGSRKLTALAKVSALKAA